MAAVTRTLNVGIAGLGLAGSGMVAAALNAMPNVQLVAAADKTTLTASLGHRG